MNASISYHFNSLCAVATASVGATPIFKVGAATSATAVVAMAAASSSATMRRFPVHSPPVIARDPLDVFPSAVCRISGVPYFRGTSDGKGAQFPVPQMIDLRRRSLQTEKRRVIVAVMMIIGRMRRPRAPLLLFRRRLSFPARPWKRLFRRRQRDARMMLVVSRWRPIGARDV